MTAQPFVLDTTTTDNYAYLTCPGATRITIQTSNAAILIGFGQSDSGDLYNKGSATYPAQDEPFLPSLGGLYRECDEIRVKSYAPGVPARVMISAR